MKKQISTNLLVLLCAIAYNALFWSEKMGVNILIFSVLMIGVLFFTHSEGVKSRPALITAFGTILTAIMVVWHNSFFAKTIHILSFVTFIGFVQARTLRFVWYGFLLGAMNIGLFIRKLSQIIPEKGLLSPRKQVAFRSLRLSVVPLLVVGVFYAIYYNANPAFSTLSDQFWTNFFQIFSWDISFERLLFFATGLFLTGGMIWKYVHPKLLENQEKQTETLIRDRKKTSQSTSHFSMIALKNEYSMGWMVLISLNALLFLVNGLDIVNVWFGEAPENPLLLKNYVHEGTYLLILAILLAMGVVLFLFRKNLNFYQKSNPLRIACFVWIAQNALLAFSVFIRNYTYINTCGLAYKRIGVMIFLALTLFGLYTLFLKIRNKKTFYFLLHRNSWALYFSLILTALVNWDVFITDYNLTANTKNGIDVTFLMNDVSDKNLFLLEQNKELLAEKSATSSFNHIDKVEYALTQKRANFEEKQLELSWLSWNYSDWRNRK